MTRISQAFLQSALQVLILFIYSRPRRTSRERTILPDPWVWEALRWTLHAAVVRKSGGQCCVRLLTRLAHIPPWRRGDRPHCLQPFRVQTVFFLLAVLAAGFLETLGDCLLELPLFVVLGTLHWVGTA